MDEKDSIKIDAELKSYLKSLVDNNKPRRVIVRSILSGVFTAFGATIVFGVAIFVLSISYKNISKIPLIGNYLEQIHLEKFLPDQE